MMLCVREEKKQRDRLDVQERLKKNQCHLAPLAGKISVSKWNEI
jgi:hypothetical protein